MRKNNNWVFMYILGILVLVLLITAAFLGPGVAFGIQDGIRCREIVAVNQEKLDVTSFNTGYERNLYRRLERFAEGIQLGKQYYETEQDMEQDQEVTEWLESDWYSRSKADELLAYDLGLLPTEEMYAYSLVRWKRCVIYDEDFSEGVNFILWYIELGQEDKTLVKLLVDGETGDLYAIRTNFDSLFQDMKDEDIYYRGKMLDIFDFAGDFIWYLYVNLGEEYGGLELEEKVKWMEENGLNFQSTTHMEVEDALEVVEVQMQIEGFMYEQKFLSANKRYNFNEIADYMNHLGWQIKEDELNFYFPYGEKGEYNLDFHIRQDGEFRSLSNWGTSFVNMTVGFPEIYERIPGFTEN